MEDINNYLVTDKSGREWYDYNGERLTKKEILKATGQFHQYSKPFTMIWIKFGSWNHSARKYFVYDRIRIKGYVWTPFVWAKKRRYESGEEIVEPPKE